MEKACILVVEDEMRIVKLLRTNLKAQGYNVIFACDGMEAVRKAATEKLDLIILDILLPGDINGYDVCKRIRSFSRVPIIMLTAKTQEQDKLEGFDAGADDYLTKPFSTQELLARIKAVLRRLDEEPEAKASLLQCGELEIDFRQASVTVKGKKVELTSTEYRLLYEMAQSSNQLVSHEELLSRVWGPEYRDERDYLRAYIWHLRKKIETNPSQPMYIISRSGLGYILVNPTP